MKFFKYIVSTVAFFALLLTTLTACNSGNIPTDMSTDTDEDSLTVAESDETSGGTADESIVETAGDTADESVSETFGDTAGETAAEDELIPPGNATYVTEHGVVAGKGHALENSLAMAVLLSDIPTGATLYFPEGTYELAFPMYVIGKSHIAFTGDEATLVRVGTDNTTPIQPALNTDALPEEYLPLTSSTSFFVIQDCTDITVHNLTFDYDTPTSLSGRVVSVDGGSAVVEITDGSVITGGEYATVINTFTSDGRPDRVLEQYAETSFTVEKLSDTTVRVSGLAPGGASNLKTGTRVCLRLCTGRDYIISAQRSTGLIFGHLCMRSSYNGGILLSERCSQATVAYVTAQSDNPEALMSLNADVLHVADMTGTLEVKGCTFDRPGDDAVNVHSGAYVVESVEGNTVTMSSPRFGNSPVWAMAGDLLTFYDPTTFAVVATGEVIAVDGKTYTVTGIDETSDVNGETHTVTVPLSAEVKAGCVVANTAMRPEVIIRDTVVANSRARGFLLQTDTATVENCTFRGISLAAILVAPDVDTWYEMSPMRSLTIHNNTFENCGRQGVGVIQIAASHDNSAKTYDSRIHGSVEITGNRFTGICTPAVYALCAESLSLQGNELDGEGYTGAYLWIKSCGTVTVSDIPADRIESAMVDELVVE